jgi:hypothetical protein
MIWYLTWAQMRVIPRALWWKKLSCGLKHIWSESVSVVILTMEDGWDEGMELGCDEGANDMDGLILGSDDGLELGAAEGAIDIEGCTDGLELGLELGETDGNDDIDGLADGDAWGIVENEGAILGSELGKDDGFSDGDWLGCDEGKLDGTVCCCPRKKLLERSSIHLTNVSKITYRKITTANQKE